MKPQSTHDLPTFYEQAWFDRHRWLLRLLNFPLTSRVARGLLGVPRGPRVSRLFPNGWEFVLGAGVRQAFFFSHPRVSHLMVTRLLPLLRALHAMDMSIGRLIPAVHAGCDVLYAYPDPGTGGSTCDGNVFRYSWEYFSALRNGSGSDANPSGTLIGVYLVATTSYLYFYGLSRGVVMFDTSPIGSGANIQSAYLQLWCDSKYDWLGQTTIDVVSATTQYNHTLAAFDYYYGNFGTAPFSSLGYADVSTGVYNNFPLNSSGISYINKTGVTKFGLRIGWDTTGSFTGTWASSAMTGYYWGAADQEGTGKDPVLVVTYQPPTVVKTDADSGALVGEDDVLFMHRWISDDDGGELSGYDQQSILVLLGDSDSGSLNAEEAQSVWLTVGLQDSDAGSLSATESAVTRVTEQINYGFDSGELSATESSSLTIIPVMSDTDSGSLSSYEEATVRTFDPVPEGNIRTIERYTRR